MVKIFVNWSSVMVPNWHVTLGFSGYKTLLNYFNKNETTVYKRIKKSYKMLRF